MVASFLLAVLATFLNIDVINYVVNVSVPTLQVGRLIGPTMSVSDVAFLTIKFVPWMVFSALVVLSTLSVLYYCVEAIRVQGLRVVGNLKQILLLVIIGYGISLSNSVSALSGLFSNQTGAFLRTPKYAITAPQQTWKGKKYQLSVNKVTALEASFVVLSSLAVARAFATENIGIIPILLIYLTGYLLVFLLTVTHSSLLARNRGRN
jgi:hypothetical protein